MAHLSAVSRRLRHLKATFTDFHHTRTPHLGRHFVSGTTGTEGKEGKASFFGHIAEAPLDPILGTNILFNADKSPNKINLGIGAYRTDDGKPYVLNVLKKAEQLLVKDAARNYEYLPQNGDVQFAKVARELIFGSTSPYLPRVTSVQTLSGTGSLRLAAAFIKHSFPNVTVFYSEPTWGTHLSILAHAGVPGKSYRYWDNANRRLDIEGMLQDLGNAPPRSIILLHACAHNPTGVDPTEEQWRRIATVVKQRQLLTWFDSAYQGFASGDLDRDAWAIRHFAEQNLEMFVSQSFAKNFGLYGERIGGLHVLTVDPSRNNILISQLNVLIRNLYSNPPKHGAELVKIVLTNPELYREWRQELNVMAQRIGSMRTALRGHLTDFGTPGDWSHITNQIGMFSYTGLNVKQCESLMNKHHIYLLKSGRISMAGINTKNVLQLAQGIDDVVRNAK